MAPPAAESSNASFSRTAEVPEDLNGETIEKDEEKLLPKFEEDQTVEFAGIVVEVSKTYAGQSRRRRRSSRREVRENQIRANLD